MSKIDSQIPFSGYLKNVFSAFIAAIGCMVHGVPMVVIPFVSDQPVNARQVKKLGLGEVLDYKTITADTLRDAAFAVMEDRRIRENLQRIQNEIARAPRNAGAVKIIEAQKMD